MEPKSTAQNNKDFQNKVWTTVGITVLVATLFLLIKSTFSVLLIVFAGILLAVYFSGLANMIRRKTGWKEGLCVGLSFGISFLILGGIGYLFGAKIQDQISELMQSLPDMIAKTRQSLENSKVGNQVLDSLSSEENKNTLQKFGGSFFQSTFGIFGDVYTILFIGVFMALSPKTYVDGVIKLVPTKGKAKAKDVLEKLGEQLRKWLKGQLIAMFVVFVMTAIGLAVIGVPLWLVLALFAGLISFIPNFGPLIALVPAVLVGLLESPEMALMVAGLYVLIQFIESNFITTTIQKKMINMPPALILISQLIMGASSGGWGLLLATPITVVVMVLVQELYTNDQEEISEDS